MKLNDPFLVDHHNVSAIRQYSMHAKNIWIDVPRWRCYIILMPMEYSNPPVNLDEYRKNLLPYTRKAFRILPEMEHPRILDIGCGTGVSTIELARLSNGKIVAIDIDTYALDRFKAKIKKARLDNRISVIERSLVDMDFPDDDFDIIWAEGSVFVLGFEKSLEQWWKFMRPGGFLVLHDEVGDLAKKTEMIHRLGYILVDHIIISGDTWWKEYFKPLQTKIDNVRDRCQGDAKALAFLQSRQTEIDTFNKDRVKNGSVIFVIQKPAS